MKWDLKKDLTLYCNCFPGHENQKTQYNQKNLMCGSSVISSEYRKELSDKGFYFDDTGENISKLNEYLGDLTGLYWIWKNTTDEIVGTNQYRRYWLEEEIDALDFQENIIYVLAPNISVNSTYDQYLQWHDVSLMNLLFKIAEQGKICLTLEDVEHLKNINIIISCNMFFAHRKLFNRICELHFHIMDVLLEEVKHSMNEINPRRSLAFLAERIFTLLFLKIDKYIPNSKFEPVSWSINGQIIHK